MTHDDTSKATGEPADAAATGPDDPTPEADASPAPEHSPDPGEPKPGRADQAEDAAAADPAENAAVDGDTAAAEDAAAVEDTDGPPEEASARTPMSSLALAVAVAALVGAVVCLGYFGYTGIRAYTVESTADQLRSQSVDAAEQAVLNITAVDPKDTAGWRKRLESSLTGDALKQVNTSVVADVEQRVSASGGQIGKLDSRITRSATTELSTADDTATVLVFANVKSTVPDQPVAQQQMGFLLTMVDVDGTRKATKVVALNPIDYTDSGSAVTSAPGAPDANTPNQEGGN